MSEHRADRRPQPGQVPVDESTQTAPLDLDEGLDDDEGVVVQQQNVGTGNLRGGGEWPHPATPPSEAAPGSTGIQDGDDHPGRRSGVYDEVTPEQAASGTTPPAE